MALSGRIKELKAKYVGWYEKIGKVRCDILDCDIVFNKKGFQHLFFKTNGIRRNDGDIRMRLGIIKHAPMIVRKARRMGDARVIQNEKSGQDVSYYSLIHRVGEKRTLIEVILRKVGKGDIHYYSIRYGRK